MLLIKKYNTQLLTILVISWYWINQHNLKFLN